MRKFQPQDIAELHKREGYNWGLVRSVLRRGGSWDGEMGGVTENKRTHVSGPSRASRNRMWSRLP